MTTIKPTIKGPRQLVWRFDGSGEWESPSIQNDEGDHFMYRIQCMEDGTFCTSTTDPELMEKRWSNRCFSALIGAKVFCQSVESGIEPERALQVCA